MVVDLFRLINTLFTAVCILVAIFFTVYCTYQFCQNEDSSVVTFSEYHDQVENIYPGLTLCFGKYHEEGTFSRREEKWIYYKDFLDGRALFETTAQKINYLSKLEDAQSAVMEEGQTSVKNSSAKANNRTANQTAEQNNNIMQSLKSSKSAGKENVQRVRKEISRDLTAEEEEIIKNVTNKLENLYEDNIALDIKDYLLFSLIKGSNVGMFVHEFPKNRSWNLDPMGDRVDQQQNETWKPLFYPSLSDIKKRCWTFEIPYSQASHIQTFGVMLNKSIFEESRRPAYKEFEIRLSYPGQQLTASTVKSNWGFSSTTNKDYTMKFEIQNMVVLKRRNKLNDECRQKWKENDRHIIEDIIAKTECVLPHWSINKTYPICTGIQIPNTTRILSNLKGITAPCQSIEKFMYLYQESSGLDFKEETFDEAKKFQGTRYSNSDIFHVMVNFQGATYMEITQSRAYDAQSLVGNAGGYVGLFLGVALIQIPSAIRMIFCLIQNLFHSD